MTTVPVVRRYPNVREWLARVGARPAVQRGLQIPPRDDGL